MLLARVYSQHCPDCPSCREGRLGSLLPSVDQYCFFSCASLDAQRDIPRSWYETFSLGLMRRGVMILQRADAQGHLSAYDAVGPGCLFPLPSPQNVHPASVPCGYATSDALVCLIRRKNMETALALSEVGKDLLTLHQAALERIARIADARGRPNGRSRVASLIVALADNLSPPRRRDSLPAGLRLRDLGALLSMRHETVCRVLKEIECVERSEDGSLHILDRVALEMI